jgi:hypothetical protein
MGTLLPTELCLDALEGLHPGEWGPRLGECAGATSARVCQRRHLCRSFRAHLRSKGRQAPPTLSCCMSTFVQSTPVARMLRPALRRPRGRRDESRPTTSPTNTREISLFDILQLPQCARLPADSADIATGAVLLTPGLKRVLRFDTETARRAVERSHCGPVLESFLRIGASGFT